MVTGIGWVDVVIVSSLFLIAVGVIWHKLVVPSLRLVEDLVDAVHTFRTVTPVLVHIGEEFRENGGTSLKDTLNRIEAAVAAKSVKLDELHAYSHTWRHTQANDMAKLVLADEIINHKLDRLAAAQGQ